MPARRPYMFMCGVPKEKCQGSLVKLNHGMDGKGYRAHGSSDQAFDCHKAYLLSQGYTQLDSRAFRSPDPDGPTRVLTKRSRFGCRLRNGKEGTRNQPDGKRCGVIVSC